MKIGRTITSLLLLLLFSFGYVGMSGGVPFGISTFSSFGADKTRGGYNVGVYGGYRFNPVLSLELSMKWRQVALSAQDCCIEKGYWLGEDGMRYHVPVAAMNGWDYSDLKSHVPAFSIQVLMVVKSGNEPKALSRRKSKTSTVLAVPRRLCPV